MPLPLLMLRLLEALPEPEPETPSSEPPLPEPPELEPEPPLPELELVLELLDLLNAEGSVVAEM